MVLRIVRYFKGGVSYDYLSNIPLSKVLKMCNQMDEIAKGERKALDEVMSNG